MTTARRRSTSTGHGRPSTSPTCAWSRPMPERVSAGGLVDLVDRLLDTGAVVAGQVTIRLADIDLVDLDARVLLTGVEAAQQRAGRPLRSETGAVGAGAPPQPL